jgi:hypothetical protein
MCEGECYVVVGIPERGLEDIRMGFLCVSRSLKSFGTGSFSNGRIHFIGFESDYHFRTVGSDCFAFVSRLVGFSIPTTWALTRVFRFGAGIETIGSANGKWGEITPIGSSSISESDGGLDEPLPGGTFRRGVAGARVEIAEPVLSLVLLIFSPSAFSDCRSLLWICIPNCVEVLSSKCLSSCKSL